MTISFDEYRAKVRTSPYGQERVRSMQTAVHEAVRAQALTGNEHWDHFLEAVEARIKQYEAERDAQQRILVDPKAVNADILMGTKMIVVACNAAIATLEDIVMLPRAIIAAGEEASGKLKGMDAREQEQRAAP